MFKHVKKMNIINVIFIQLFYLTVQNMLDFIP
jgi:hypothetical protein